MHVYFLLLLFPSIAQCTLTIQVSTILDFSSKKKKKDIPIYSKPHFIFTILLMVFFSHQFLKSTSKIVGGGEKKLESMPCMTL